MKIIFKPWDFEKEIKEITFAHVSTDRGVSPVWCSDYQAQLPVKTC